MKAISAQGSSTGQIDETAWLLFPSLLMSCTRSFHFSAIIYESLWVFFLFSKSEMPSKDPAASVVSVFGLL